MDLVYDPFGSTPHPGCKSPTRMTRFIFRFRDPNLDLNSPSFPTIAGKGGNPNFRYILLNDKTRLKCNNRGGDCYWLGGARSK